jgi:hypothetical protein
VVIYAELSCSGVGRVRNVGASHESPALGIASARQKDKSLISLASGGLDPSASALRLLGSRALKVPKHGWPRSSP